MKQESPVLYPGNQMDAIQAIGESCNSRYSEDTRSSESRTTGRTPEVEGLPLAGLVEGVPELVHEAEDSEGGKTDDGTRVRFVDKEGNSLENIEGSTDDHKKE